MNYEILEHPSDLKIRAYGKTKEDLFSHILEGMFESIGPEIKEEKEIKREIKIQSSDEQSLLIDFLSQALYLSDINNEAYFSAEFEELTEKRLKGKIFGRKINGFQKEIKAVTYHDLEIKKNEQGLWQATALFDI